MDEEKDMRGEKQPETNFVRSPSGLEASSPKVDPNNQTPTRQAHILTNTYPPLSISRSMSTHVPESLIGTDISRHNSTNTQPPVLQTGHRLRPSAVSNLSFYDVKEMRRSGSRTRPLGPSSRWSWADFKSGDAISEHLYGSPLPPHMGTPQAPRPPSRGGLPWTMWMNSTAKNHFVASLGEFVGTTMFLFFAFAGTEVANIGSDAPAGTTTNETTGFSPIKLLYIALSFGFSLMVNAWIFFRISGALFNPAVTLAMLLVGAVRPARAIFLFLSQIVGSIAASAMVMGIFPARLNVLTTLSEPTSIVRGIFIEAFLTAELVFTILMLAKEKHRSTFIAPVGIGLALFIGQLVGVFYTGGSLNPARSFGPAVVTNSWDKNHWIYWVGPIAGALIAVAFYKFIKLLEYEMANPGQDADDWNDPTRNPHHEVRMKQRDKTTKVLHSLGLDHFKEKQGDEEAPQVEPQTPKGTAAPMELGSALSDRRGDTAERDGGQTMPSSPPLGS